MSGRPALRTRIVPSLAMLAHLGLMTGVATTIADFALPAAARAVLIALGLLPLALTFRGLAATDRGVLRWLALALVLYCGLGTVEVIAAGSLAAAAVLLCALVELALTLNLIRSDARARAATAES